VITANQSFEHKPSAHCETGAIANLLRHNGLDISEPMVFGLASAMTFAYINQVKINGMPLIAYRLPPKLIVKFLSWRLPGLKFKFETFKNETVGMQALDQQLANGNVVGLQTSVFFLPYFPEAMRFHFNAHNLLVFDKQDDEYHISDPVFSHLVTAREDDVCKARFAKGVLAPKGSMYYPASMPSEIAYDVVIPKAIRFMAKMNGPFNPVPISGINGIRRLAKTIRRLDKYEERYARLFMGHIVRMQEEIGTGGAGFRFIYAAFLQEAGKILNLEQLNDYSHELTRIGDEWRDFAVLAARLSKQRRGQDFNDAAEQLSKVAELELDFYRRLSKFKITKQ
jgi:hypothetical protein